MLVHLRHAPKGERTEALNVAARGHLDRLEAQRRLFAQVRVGRHEHVACMKHAEPEWYVVNRILLFIFAQLVLLFTKTS